jgi:hypothetical protein
MAYDRQAARAQAEASRRELIRKWDEEGPGVELVATADPNDFYGIEERCKRAWAQDPKLRAEFVEIERYIAFVKADQKGLVKIFGRSRQA